MNLLKERIMGGPSWEESVWRYRLYNWRCTLFGHSFYLEDEYLEGIYYVATYRFCRRCDYGECLGQLP